MTGSYLRHYQPVEPWDDDELFLARRAAWRKQGIATIRPEDIGNEVMRRYLVLEMERRYGKRIDHAGNRG